MHITPLMAAMGSAFLAMLLGMWLSSLYLLRDEPPRGMVVGLIHGAFGAASVALLFLALQGRPAGNFAWTAFAMLFVTLLLGLGILATHLARRGAAAALTAIHACFGIAGVLILCAYFIGKGSFGR